MTETVEIDVDKRWSEDRTQKKYGAFPEKHRQKIRSAVESIPQSVFFDTPKGREVKEFDRRIAENLPDYEFVDDAEVGNNPHCQLWSNLDFDHSVDLYHPEDRIAIEIEKSERKTVSFDILKFIRGGKTQRDGRKKIRFGCMVVPTNYGRSKNNLAHEAVRNLNFMSSVLFVEDVLILGSVDPRQV